MVHLGFLNIAFGTAPLTPVQWAICLGMGSVVLWYSELRKLVTRLWAPPTAGESVSWA